ncbi:MAG TPA: DUF2914 domain-containing protein [Thermoanaerobaculia bacterium]|nr:DUF2914 domain-containing protein [Thermoanaerobaculia bacterium]
MAVREKVRSTYERVRPWAPAAFFIGGFLWDAITLGRSITSLDLFILLAYLAGAATILVALGSGVAFKGSQYLKAVLQFFFGGIFSALFIFYFLSSSGLPEYLVVIGLAALLLGNEFLESRYSELTLSWTLFTMSAAMFFNFALAHLFRSISTFWFYLGTLVAVALVLALRKVSKTEAASVWPSIAVAALMLTLHVFNIIPPVPLVKKEMLIAHSVTHRADGYVAMVESSRWRFWKRSSTTFHDAGDRMYCFTSVFVPRGIQTTIRHRWLYDAGDEWRNMGVVPFTISGGREGGYRGYTYKTRVTPGRWRVIAESESGASIGIIDVVVEPGAVPKLKKVKL